MEVSQDTIIFNEEDITCMLAYTCTHENLAEFKFAASLFQRVLELTGTPPEDVPDRNRDLPIISIPYSKPIADLHARALAYDQEEAQKNEAIHLTERKKQERTLRLLGRRAAIKSGRVVYIAARRRY